LVKIEGTLEEIRAIFVEEAKNEAKRQAKTAGKNAVRKGIKVAKNTATKRAPSAYNKHMKKELARLKKKHPKTSHNVLFKRAAKSWKGSKKKKGGKK
jgi:hypothetical protein